MRYLLLIDTAGKLCLGDVDNGARVGVGDPGHPSSEVRTTTAVWSPAGQWTAWSVDSAPSDAAAAVGTSAVHELRLHDERTDTTVVLAEQLSAFYLCPSPCGRYLSHLSAGPLGLELAVSEIRTGELRIVERGQPLFWSWSQDSTRLAVHVGNRVVVATADGTDLRVLAHDAEAFVAPWWMPGDSVAYVLDDRLVSTAPDGSTTPLTEDLGTGRFAVDADGRRIALVDGSEGHDRLVVLDLLTGERHHVTEERTAAFFWSPTGRRLAVLVLAPPRDLQWLVFDGTSTIRLAPFRPGRAWMQAVLPFFEQYSQSHAVWSSDGTHLVASSLDADDNPEALVQSVEAPFTHDRLPGVDLAWWANP